MNTSHDWDRQTEDDLRGGVLAALRPAPAELDSAWRQETLARILGEAEPPRRRTRRGRQAWVAGAVVVAVAGGGAAAATGTVPDFVSGTMSRLVGQSGDANGPEVHLIADVPVPGGGRFAAWRGIEGDQLCGASANNWDGREGSASYGVSCGAIARNDPDWDEVLFSQTFSPDADGDRYYPVVYGAAEEPQVASVLVHGRLFDGGTYERTVAVDPATHGFGVVVPGSRSRASMQREWNAGVGETTEWDSNLRSVVIDLLDAEGQLVRRVTLFDYGR